MALDLTQFRKKLNELNSGVKGPFWKPKDAETVIRIVPLASNPSNPFQELYFHYIDNKTYLSPATFGDPDPFQEYSDSLIAQGNLSKEEYKAAKKLCPVARTYVPVIVRGEEKLGVRFWAFGQGIFKDLLTVMADGEYNDITDLEAGHDIKVSFTPKDPNNPKSFPDTKIMIRPKPSPVSNDPDMLDKFLNQQPVLLDEFTLATYDELTELLNKQFGAPSASPAPAPRAAAAPPAPRSAPAAAAATDEDDWATPAAPAKAAPAAKAPATTRGSAPATPASADEDEFDNIFNS